MQFDHCPLCGTKSNLIFNNNPIGFPLCESCLNNQLDPQNLKHAEFFCRTFNYPFLPDRWLQHPSFSAYTDLCLTENPNNLKFSTKTADLWSQTEELHSKHKSIQTLLTEIKPLQDEFIEDMRLKWGDQYSFDQLLYMENLYNTTIQSNAIESEMTKDAIKKACKLSVEIDTAITSGDSKAIKDLSGAQKAFLDNANLNDIMNAATDTNTIATIADLAQYLEDTGFEPHFYDNVDRDIVDKTIKDNQQYLRNLVQDATGLTGLLERTAETYKAEKEQKATADAIAAKPLEEIILDDQAAVEEKEAADLLEEMVYTDDDADTNTDKGEEQ